MFSEIMDFVNLKATLYTLLKCSATLNIFKNGFLANYSANKNVFRTHCTFVNTFLILKNCLNDDKLQPKYIVFKRNVIILPFLWNSTLNFLFNAVEDIFV